MGCLEGLRFTTEFFFLAMTNNGLREIIYKDDPAAISKFVDFGYHFISLYLDHIRYKDDPAAISKFVDFGYHFFSLYLDHDVVKLHVLANATKTRN
jgi:hypothetical protein